MKSELINTQHYWLLSEANREAHRLIRLVAWKWPAKFWFYFLPLMSLALGSSLTLAMLTMVRACLAYVVTVKVQNNGKKANKIFKLTVKRKIIWKIQSRMVNLAQIYNENKHISTIAKWWSIWMRHSPTDFIFLKTPQLIDCKILADVFSQSIEIHKSRCKIGRQ